ncbi:protein Iojap-related, mitochondrial [Aristolochia californica]|uniref:protein Iojap-related, mitochondrial n=1 Tax=Aristolochia californica TaxID=171875 RepID=UPI0035DBBEA2
MLSAIRSRSINLFPQALLEPWSSGFFRALSTSGKKLGFLDLQEVEKVLSDVKADDVKVIPVGDRCDWTDFMVIATGRSNWHVKNIAQALIYKAKQKQKSQLGEGIDQLMLPSVVGQEGGKWVVIDNGNMIIHALEEKARDYYDLDSLWTTEMSAQGPDQELEKSLERVRPKNNSKKRVQESAPS